MTNPRDIFDSALLRAYIGQMPGGRYQRRDDDPCGIYRDGVKIFSIQSPTSPDRDADGVAGALVYMLNKVLNP